MERQRGIKALSLVALIVAVLGLTVAFAAMTQTLTINGTAKVDTAKWDIHYEYITDGEKTAKKLQASTTGHASVPNPETAKIDEGATSISDIDMTLTRPGDSVSYDFNVVNAGDINAKITTFTKQVTPTCTGTDSDAEKAAADADLVCGNLTYSLNYVTTEGENEVLTPVAENDTLDGGQTKKLRLTLKYDGTTLPGNDVNLTNMTITTIYTQAD